MSYGLGVDLGTTFTAAAVAEAGRVRMVNLGQRAAAVPSLVAITAADEILIGEAAQGRAVAEPDRVVREFKRRVGDRTPLLAGRDASALMALLARGVLEIVAAREGAPPSVVAVTHPANWRAYKTDLLVEAFAAAGLSHVRTTTEPEAAVTHYATNERVQDGAMVAVYDLGGGTFDAAVLRREGDRFTILGVPEGVDHLGGIDFDAAVRTYVNRAVDGAIESADVTDPAVAAALAGLHRDCVEAKETLSADTEAMVPVRLPGLFTEIRITRREFERMIRPTLTESISAMRRALRAAGVGPDELSAVLLVGGSSRIPLVAQLVGAELGRPVAVDAHPKHAVAMGAALLAEPSRPSLRMAAAAAPVPPVSAPVPPASAPVPPVAPTSGPGAAQDEGSASARSAKRTTPEVPQARVTEPAVSVPDRAVPDRAVPDRAVPDRAVPDLTVPDQTVLDVPTPPGLEPAHLFQAAQARREDPVDDGPSRPTVRVDPVDLVPSAPATVIGPRPPAPGPAPLDEPVGPPRFPQPQSQSPPPVEPRPIFDPPSPTGSGRRSRLPLVAAAAAVLALVALVAFLLSRGGKDEVTTGSDAASASSDAADTVSSSAAPTTTAPTTTVPTTAAPATAVPVEAAPATAAPAAVCDPAPGPFVCLVAATVDAQGNLSVPFQATGFEPFIGSAPNLHIHFFFDVEPMRSNAEAAGTPSLPGAKWILWDKPNPFGVGGATAPYTLAEAQAVGATQICALVADSNHKVTTGSGTCVALPV